MTSTRFTGKLVLITGAGRGMGKSCALTFAEQGAAVAVNDVDLAAAERVADRIRNGGGRAAAFGADVSDEGQVQEMVARCLETFGAVHILVNNAGILRATKPMEAITADEWDLVMAVNVRGVFLCTRYVLPQMKARREGKIINISSSAGRSTSTFGGAHYTASKAAVLGLTRHTAREAAAFNINVNAVTPGSMDTEMVRKTADPATIEAERKAVPLGRLGTAADEASLVTFLASEQSSYITGATIDINGGILMI